MLGRFFEGVAQALDCPSVSLARRLVLDAQALAHLAQVVAADGHCQDEVDVSTRTGADPFAERGELSIRVEPGGQVREDGSDTQEGYEAHEKDLG